VAVNYWFTTTKEEQVEKITISISMPFTEEEAKNVKKAFEQAALRKPPFLGEEWEWNKEKSLNWWKRNERASHGKQ
jgi:hypothetical protein